MMRREALLAIRSVTLVGVLSFVVGIGFARFAYTPLLPMMLRDHTIDLQEGAALASLHYLGYFLGALFSMLLPWLLRQCRCRIPQQSSLLRYNLLAITLFIFGMALPFPALWPFFRFATGFSSALAFIYTSAWTLQCLAELGALSLSALVYSGPGLGIILSGLIATIMLWFHCSSTMAWLGFALLAAFLTGIIWTHLREGDGRTHALLGMRDAFIPLEERWHWEHLLFSIAYGLAGFGYIITATFLPVIAHETISSACWVNFLWPLFGIGVVLGALSAQKIPRNIDRRLLLFSAYLMQSLGVFLPHWFNNQWGFFLGIFLLGFPFNLISLLAMQEARRLSPVKTTIFMSSLTAMYAIGQILGPSLTSYFLTKSNNHAEGFLVSLSVASGSLLLGGFLCLFLKFYYPSGVFHD